MAMFLRNNDAHDSPIIAARAGDAAALKSAMNRGRNFNAQDEEGMTALHHAASIGARPCIRLLIRTYGVDYLIRDNYGRYASELAYQWGQDYAVALLLSKKQAQQANREGKTLWPERSSVSRP